MLTPQQDKNLRTFLARVELKGSEVAAFNELVDALFAPAPVTKPSPVEEIKPEEPRPVDAVQEKKDA